jgi:hypothetical protein
MKFYVNLCVIFEDYIFFVVLCEITELNKTPILFYEVKYGFYILINISFVNLPLFLS